MLDLCSETDDLLGASRDITGKGILGYYQIDEKILTVVIDEEQLEPRGWLIYAHEYTHALQDQQFDLSMILEPGDDGFDIIKAVRALMEGDANFTQFLFYESLPQEQQALLAKELEGDIEEFSRSQEVTQAPRIIRETFGWEHGAGPVSLFRINVRLTVRQKCHPFGLRWYQMATLWMRPGTDASVDFQRQCISLPCLYGFPIPWPSVEWTSP